MIASRTPSGFDNENQTRMNNLNQDKYVILDKRNIIFMVLCMLIKSWKYYFHRIMEVESILEIFIICLSSICILRSYSVLHNSTNLYFLTYVDESVRKCVVVCVFDSCLRSNSFAIVVSTHRILEMLLSWSYGVASILEISL